MNPTQNQPQGIGDGERPAPLPSTETTNHLPDDADQNPDGVMHSPTNIWPPVKNDPSKPFKNLR